MTTILAVDELICPTCRNSDPERFRFRLADLDKPFRLHQPIRCRAVCQACACDFEVDIGMDS